MANNPILPVQTLTLTATQTSFPVRAPAGTEISVAITSGTCTVDYTYSPLAAVQAGTATWVVGGIGTYSASTSTPVKIWKDCFVRVACSAGSVSVAVDPQGATVAPTNSPTTEGGGSGAVTLSAMQAGFDSGTPPQQAAFQSSVSVARNPAMPPQYLLGGMLGDSRTQVGGGYLSNIDANAQTFGWPFVLQALNGFRWKWKYFGGVNNSTTAQVLARAPEAVASGIDFCTVLAGVNDPWATNADVDASIANVIATYEILVAGGVYVYGFSETPNPVSGATWHRFAKRFNAALIAYWAQPSRRARGRYIDVWTPMIVPSTGVGLPARYSSDVHQNSAGSLALASAIAHEFPSRVSFAAPVYQLAADINDVHAVNTNSSQYYSNPMMLGTGGDVTGGNAANTGSLPASVSAVGPATQACSIYARADGLGNDARTVITGAAGNVAATRFTGLNLADFPTGSKWIALADVTIESATAINSVSLGFDTGYRTVESTGQYENTGLLNISSPVNLTLATPEFTITQSATNSVLQLLSRSIPGQAWSAVMRVGRVTLLRLA